MTPTTESNLRQNVSGESSTEGPRQELERETRDLKKRRLGMDQTPGYSDGRNLAKIPIEIFAEICSWLHPLDLRHLVLTGRLMRDILMNKDAKHIWKTVISLDTDLPECPPDISEPRYVRLLYSTECDTPECNAKGTMSDWFSRHRLCGGCYFRKMADGPDLAAIVGDVCEDSGLLEIIELLNAYTEVRGGRCGTMTLLGNRIGLKHGLWCIGDVNHAIETYRALLRQPDYQVRIPVFFRTLKEQRQLRIPTGDAMQKWEFKYMNSQFDARYNNVHRILVEVGWDPNDVPEVYSPAFRSFFPKHVLPAPEVWEIKRLIERMMLDLGLDADNAIKAELKNLKNLICTRCDQRIAKYSSFSQIAFHYIQAQQWFLYTQRFKQCHSQPHVVIDDHDWILNETSLIKQNDDEERASIKILQDEFQASLGISRGGLRSNSRVLKTWRLCHLCPRTLSPLSCPIPVIEIHIRAKHGKEPYLNTDTTLGHWNPTPLFPCPT